MLPSIKASPTMFNQIVVAFTAFVALVTVYEFSFAHKMAQILKGASSTFHHSSNSMLHCQDPRSDIEFKMFEFHGRNTKNDQSNHRHQSTYFVSCQDGFEPIGNFRRGEIRCWAGEWIWLTSTLECQESKSKAS
mmetsp:Transcript_18876/g.30007  ORF Transcript_18876/g.30007 Transcript_18876/m.30007 type:complete len:134 (+) Transcript_18876:63-464(+)